jgi:hypothetical protein
MDESASTKLVWIKSSRSMNGNCVEVAADALWVFVRDSQHPTGPILVLTRDAWCEFLEWIRRDGTDAAGNPATLRQGWMPAE